jgi:hypothetical protein
MQRKEGGFEVGDKGTRSAGEFNLVVVVTVRLLRFVRRLPHQTSPYRYDWIDEDKVVHEKCRSLYVQKV